MLILFSGFCLGETLELQLLLLWVWVGVEGRGSVSVRVGWAAYQLQVWAAGMI